MPCFRSTLFCTLTVCLFGCNTGTRYPKLDPFSNMAPPGTIVNPNARSNTALINEERNQAVRYDPFPDNDIGPEIDGGRPRDYGQQLPETVRGRWTR